MKKVKFKNLLIQNFLSVGEEKLYLNFQQGINLITGINKDKESKNGCGKTTILDALYWCIFGNTIRDIKKDKIVHNHSDSKCKVDLIFSISDNDKNEIEYKIERSLNPSKVSLFKKEEDTTYSTIQKTDEAIKELFGANEELFRNSIIMSLDNTLPFMAQKKVEKRKFIESILQINIFSDMLLKVRQDYNDTKKKYDILANSFTEKQKTLSFFKSQKIKNEDLKNQKIKILEEKIKTNNLSLHNNKIDELQEKIEKIKNSIIKTENAISKFDKNIEDTQEKQLQHSKEESKIQIELENTEKQIKTIKNKTGSCPTCKRKLEDEDDETILYHLNALNEQIKEKEKLFNETLSIKNKLSLEKNSFVQKKNELISILKELKQKQNKIDILINETKNIVDKNKEIQIQIDELINQKDDIDDKIYELNEESKIIEEQILKNQKTLTILENSKLIVSEEGVKTYIVKKLLILLNQKLNFYLKKLDAPCTCNFDELFEETIVNSNGKECSYFNFSGGERKRIDLAVLFTFQDILKSQTGVYYSVNMYDELFDSALDLNGTTKAIEILKENSEKYKESIYIISHNSSVSKNNIDHVIELEKINGKTKIVN